MKESSMVAQLTLEDVTQQNMPFDLGGSLTGTSARAALARRYADKLITVPALTRSLVSFQANKSTPFYRWFRYREGFSSELVRYILARFQPASGSDAPRILDPFAGAGTTLTTSTKAGWQATGIELLPVGTAATRARLYADIVNVDAFQRELTRLASFPLTNKSAQGYQFPHIRITSQAFPEKTEQAISAYMVFLNDINDEAVHFLFWFACFSILEDVSFTRKDGQYLRWDNRSGRALKATFNKGPIYEFRPAIVQKLQMMLEDIRKRNGGTLTRNVSVIEGSSLVELPRLQDESFELVVTSPPYCNRYDYTRTYALELAFLNYGEEGVKNLRQTMLSCTVENKSKREWLAAQYRARGQEEAFNKAAKAFDNQQALQEVLRFLDTERAQGKLNNKNICDLVENYFFEMSFVIHELARLLAPSGHIVMVNDNVQYNGEEVPVDLILSDYAARAGLNVDNIWVLPRGKGNSSQQMGVHGRKELRKCIYVWSKPITWPTTSKLQAILPSP
jgi:SAM-dependent methyltransferase